MRLVEWHRDRGTEMAPPWGGSCWLARINECPPTARSMVSSPMHPRENPGERPRRHGPSVCPHDCNSTGALEVERSTLPPSASTLIDAHTSTRASYARRLRATPSASPPKDQHPLRASAQGPGASRAVWERPRVWRANSRTGITDGPETVGPYYTTALGAGAARRDQLAAPRDGVSRWFSTNLLTLAEPDGTRHGMMRGSTARERRALRHGGDLGRQPAYPGQRDEQNHGREARGRAMA